MSVTALDLDLLAYATPEERRQYETDLLRETALLSPLDYALYCSDGRVKRHKHTELLSVYCMAVVDRRLYDDGIGPPAVWVPDPEADDEDEGAWRHPETGEEAHNILLISAPPQHGKSLIVSETVPAWYLTRYPHNRVAVTGYEADFAKGFGRSNRNKIEDTPEFGVFISKDSRAADAWDIEGHDGGLVTAGAGGPITGKRADLILIDDPVKNSQDALSEAKRKQNKDWWQSVIKSRVRTNTVIIVIQTRWHEDDLSGHVATTERCYKLNLPALAFDSVDEDGFSVDPDTGERDMLGRKPGQALCPALQTKAMLLKKQLTGDGAEGPGGMLWFSALYQGKPNIEGGGQLGKPYRYHTTETNFSGRKFYKTKDGTGRTRESYVNECIYFITADLAVSAKNTADYTVFSLFAWTPWNQLLLVDMLRERIESTEHMAKAIAFWRKARNLTGGAGIRFFGVESQTYGISLLQALRKERGNRIPVKELKADRDKIARAIPIGMMNQADELFLPAGHALLGDLEAEMMIFPNGTHDDMVDTLGYAARESLILPRRDLSDPLSHPEQLRAAKKKRKRFHPTLGRLP